MVQTPVQGQQKMRWEIQLKQWESKKGLKSSFLHLWSIQALKRLDDSHCKGASILLNPPIQRLFSPRNTFPDTPSNNVNLGTPVPRHTKLIITSVLAAEVYKALCLVLGWMQHEYETISSHKTRQFCRALVGSHHFGLLCNPKWVHSGEEY